MKIFINSNSQIRAGWKIIMVIALSVLLLIAMGIGLNRFNISDTYGVSIFISFILAIWIMLRFIDKKDFRYIGVTSFRKSYKDFFVGLILGIICITLNIIILIAIGHGEFKGSIFNPNVTPSIISGLILFIIVAVTEELFFRGYIITTMQQMNKWWISAFVSSIIFSLTHGALNDNVSFIAVLNLFLAGMLLAYIFIRTKNIWMCIGFHITWNYFQGYIFGVAVSGRMINKSIYTININEGAIAGGGFGLEGGIINTIVLIGAFIYVRNYSKSSKKITKKI